MWHQEIGGEDQTGWRTRWSEMPGRHGRKPLKPAILIKPPKGGGERKTAGEEDPAGARSAVTEGRPERSGKPKGVRVGGDGVTTVATAPVRRREQTSETDLERTTRRFVRANGTGGWLSRKGGRSLNGRETSKGRGLAARKVEHAFRDWGRLFARRMKRGSNHRLKSAECRKDPRTSYEDPSFAKVSGVGGRL
jgi:hypothetical protein